MRSRPASACAQGAQKRVQATNRALNSLRLVDTDPAAAQKVGATMEERKHEKEKHEAPVMLGHDGKLRATPRGMRS
jgi:hypothetical protein